MTKTLLASAAALALLAAPAAFAQDAAAPAPAGPAAAAKLSVKSAIKDLIANAGTKAVLTKHVAPVVDFFETGQNDGVGLPDTITLEEIAQFPEANISPDLLKTIDSELAAL